MRMWRAGERLQSRRDLPPEAFYTVAELESLLRACQLARRGELALQAFGSLCVALCYRWIEADHPDPDQWHLGLVGRMAHTYTQAVCKPLFADLAAAGLHMGDADFALFWDYASIHLEPRPVTVPKVEIPNQPDTPAQPSSPPYHLSPQPASARRLAASALAAHHTTGGSTTSGTSAGVATRDGRWLQLATKSDARVWVKRPQPPAEEIAPARRHDPIAEALRRHREDEAKRLSALWYGHQHVVCWVSPTLPGTFLLDHDDEDAFDLPRCTHRTSGWISLELELASFLKQRSKLLDISAHPPPPSTPLTPIESARWFQQELVPACTVTRGGGPPLLPAGLSQLLRHERRWQLPRDAELACEIHSGFFAAATRLVHSLDFSGLGWTSYEIAQLGKLIPCCPRCRTLDVSHNPIGAHGGALLVRLLSHQECALTHLNVRHTSISADGVEW